MNDFNLDNFMASTNLISKHPEIFESGRKLEIKKFLDIFVKYTKIANEEKNIDKLIKKIQLDYNQHDQYVDKIEPQSWNKHYSEYEVPQSHKMKLNDMYIFPHNTKGKKLSSPIKFYINCIRLGDSTNIRLINRNGHMVLTGDNVENKVLGTKVTYKMLILYNHINKKWIVSPFKMVSNPPHGVRCDSFARAATTEYINEQYNIWKNGLSHHAKNLGIVNFKYTDPKFKNFPNLFSPSQSNQILSLAKSISGGSVKLKSKKSKKSKKTSKKTSKKEVKGVKRVKKSKKSKKKSKKTSKKTSKRSKKSKKSKKE
jgi:hypothetical protein